MWRPTRIGDNLSRAPKEGRRGSDPLEQCLVPITNTPEGCPKCQYPMSRTFWTVLKELPQRIQALLKRHDASLPPSASAGSPNTCASVLPVGPVIARTGHRVDRRNWKPLATPIPTPQISFVRGVHRGGLDFDGSFVRSRYGPPGCSPPATGLTRPDVPQGLELIVFLGLPGLLLPGFQLSESPRMAAGYHYGVKLRITPRPF